jgi:hypothetical protein
MINDYDLVLGTSQERSDLKNVVVCSPRKPIIVLLFLTASSIFVSSYRIPNNKPYLIGTEIQNIENIFSNSAIESGGKFSKLCQAWMTEHLKCSAALLVSSGTSALDMIAILLDLQPGDEVIMPSFTFVSTANAFVLRGAIPVFVDIRGLFLILFKISLFDSHIFMFCFC